MDINNLCPHCMREIKKEEKTVCPYCGKALNIAEEIQHQLKPFTILQGKYLIGDVLGEGGFGITYIGFDLNLETRVAIKEFYPSGHVMREANTTTEVTVYSGQSADIVNKWRDNFIKEARSLAKCTYLSGVVGVKDFFQENNTAYIVLEYLDGVTLKEYVKNQGGKVSLDWLLSAIEPVIISLGEVHKEGMIHRDISPDNIMLLKNGGMKLLDFGAARDYSDSGERSLSVLLKPGYAPEEQYRTKGKQGPWSDIYAFAGTIYKCITGITPPEAMERIRTDELKKPSELGVEIDAEKEQALIKALEVFAENRYQTMEEFHRKLYGDIDEKTFGLINENRTKCIENTDRQNIQGKRDILQNKKIIMAICIGIVSIVICTGIFWGKHDAKMESKKVSSSIDITTDESGDSTLIQETVSISDEQTAESIVTEEADTENGYEQNNQENERAMIAYNDVLINGAIATGAFDGGEWKMGIDYCYGIGYYCLYDFDSDGIDECIATGGIPSIPQSGCDGSIILDYVDNEVLIITGRVTAGYGMVPLINGYVCSFNSYYTDKMITSYSVSMYADGYTEELVNLYESDDGVSKLYYINDSEVDVQSFNTYLEENILSKQIPSSCWREFNEENGIL